MRLLNYIKQLPIQRPLLGDCLTSPRTTLARNPRVANNALRPWPRFFEMMEKRFKDEMDQDLDLAIPHYWAKFLGCPQVDSEADLAKYASKVLELPCEWALDALYRVKNVQFLFTDPRPALNIGRPDSVLRLFATGSNRRFMGRMVVEYKTPWALPLEDVDLVKAYHANMATPKNSLVQAVNQLYGYMSLNSITYGILSTVASTRVFRRVVDKSSPMETILECSPEIPWDGKGIHSPLAAYIYAGYLVFRDKSFHHSLFDQAIQTQRLVFDDINKLHAPIPGLEYEDTRELSFVLGEVLGRNYATTAKARVLVKDKIDEEGEVIIKVYDLGVLETRERYERELEIYQRLSALQGKYIPRLYTHGEVGLGYIGLLVLEDCGDVLREEEWDHSTQLLAKEALEAVHTQGVIHNDIKLGNIAHNKRDRRWPIRIIDFGESAFEQADEGQFSEEIDLLTKL